MRINEPPTWRITVRDTIIYRFRMYGCNWVVVHEAQIPLSCARQSDIDKMDIPNTRILIRAEDEWKAYQETCVRMAMDNDIYYEVVDNTVPTEYGGEL